MWTVGFYIPWRKCHLALYYVLLCSSSSIYLFAQIRKILSAFLALSARLSAGREGERLQSLKGKPLLFYFPFFVQNIVIFMQMCFFALRPNKNTIQFHVYKNSHQIVILWRVPRGSPWGNIWMSAWLRPLWTVDGLYLWQVYFYNLTQITIHGKRQKLTK